MYLETRLHRLIESQTHTPSELLEQARKHRYRSKIKCVKVENFDESRAHFWAVAGDGLRVYYFPKSEVKVGFTRGTLYRVKPESIWWEQSDRFCFAKPALHTAGTDMGDCWIVDQNGRKHPGFGIHPYPMHIDSMTVA